MYMVLDSLLCINLGLPDSILAKVTPLSPTSLKAVSPTWYPMFSHKVNSKLLAVIFEC